MSRMSYVQAMDYLYRRLPMFQRQGPRAFKKDLNNIRFLLKETGRPHLQFHSIHVAGTNGKGSVSHILAGMLTKAGFKTGLYSSPHYKDFRERIKINGMYIPRARVSRFVEKYREAIEQVEASFFEVTVAMAFDYFASAKVDFAVIETGLGGRLDSTNVLNPLLSIITNIGLDHQNMLGDTLSQIASEKAGIIKPDTPVLIGEKQKEVLPVFRRKAQTTHSPLYLAENWVKIKNYRKEWTGIEMTLQVKDRSPQRIETDLAGPYQVLNLRTAIAAYEVLRQIQNLPPWQARWLTGIRQVTRLLGRWMILQSHPLVLADSAHNEAGLKILAQALKKIPHRRTFIVIGTVQDKSPGYLFKILPKQAVYHFAKANIPRGMDANRLRDIAHQQGIEGKAYSSVRRALAAAKRKAGKEDLILVCGSIFVVAEVI